MFDLFRWRWYELGFVVALLLAVFGVSFYQLQTSKMKTRDAQRKADTELVGRALQAYYADYRVYPAASESGTIVSCGSRGMSVCVWGGERMVDEDNVVYLEKMPEDPYAFKGYRYVYEVDEDRKHFKLYSSLEYTSDEHYRSNLTTQCGTSVECNWVVEN